MSNPVVVERIENSSTIKVQWLAVAASDGTDSATSEDSVIGYLTGSWCVPGTASSTATTVAVNPVAPHGVVVSGTDLSGGLIVTAAPAVQLFTDLHSCITPSLGPIQIAISGAEEDSTLWITLFLDAL